jgi:Lar family restriction alleviation protein
MDEALKPCPFCGSPPMPDYCSTTDGPAYSFHCHAKDCPAWPNVQGETEAEAIAAWNTRAGEPQ